MARRLARYTGLSEAYVESVHLRITRNRFRKELLRDENRTVGRIDSATRASILTPPASSTSSTRR